MGKGFYIMENENYKFNWKIFNIFVQHHPPALLELVFRYYPEKLINHIFEGKTDYPSKKLYICNVIDFFIEFLYISLIFQNCKRKLFIHLLLVVFNFVMVVSTFIVKSTLVIFYVVFAYFLMSVYAFFFSALTCLLTNCIFMHFLQCSLNLRNPIWLKLLIQP